MSSISYGLAVYKLRNERAYMKLVVCFHHSFAINIMPNSLVTSASKYILRGRVDDFDSSQLIMRSKSLSIVFHSAFG